jgi:hypothetical protein
MSYLPVLMRLESLQPRRLPGLRELYREQSRRMGSAHLDFGRREPEIERIQFYRSLREPSIGLRRSGDICWSHSGHLCHREWGGGAKGDLRLRGLKKK